MSRRTARHRKSSRPAPVRARGGAHRKPSPVAAALTQNNPKLLAAAVTGSMLVAAAAPAAARLADEVSRMVAPSQGLMNAVSAGAAQVGGSHGATSPLTSQSAAAAPKPFKPAGPGLRTVPSAVISPARPARHHTPRHAAPPAPGYQNPFRDVSGLIPERIDMGVDFGGSGPVHALGDAVITNATSGDAGWPGGGWITYQLTGGPDAGLMVYVAEDVTPAVQVGQHVTSSTVIATMFNGGDGIETGWAMPDGSSAESQLPAAGGISGGGPFPTRVGVNFEEMLQSLGVPASYNRNAAPYGVLPSNYPTSW